MLRLLLLLWTSLSLLGLVRLTTLGRGAGRIWPPILPLFAPETSLIMLAS